MSGEGRSTSSEPPGLTTYREGYRDGVERAAEEFRSYWRDRWPNGPEEFDMEWRDWEANR